MATSFPNYDGGTNHKEALTRFINAVRSFLGELIEGENKDRLGGELFYPELRGQMKAAWPEIKGEFAKVLTALGKGDRKAALIEHGLFGKQLRFKLDVSRHLYKVYKLIGPGKRILKQLLDSIDAVLDSIFDALHVGKAIKEFKDCVKAAIIAEVDI